MSAPASSKRKARKKSQTPVQKSSKPRAAATKSQKSSPTLSPAQPVEVQAHADEPVTDAAAPEKTAAVVTDEQIGERAYQIWLEKGRPYGQEQVNWDQAVAELRG